ncbi:MAG: UDP-N-acetylglucosamine--N-acetylmuramyl-(pentapeptide) pyrophosphoryl-undecaprenol N-acetylglucosamine transferase [Chloroflexi bacterium]|nr:UDP-N-acetylglucosamine--N-acetylmuramyl-(pentapeptide) pyrophosphoryl-undecaprenol N-acetylglucosamine transferase [Chloroflexota bacterium]MBA3851999.1 UDP-N-acetylglucosamine--N-acetylmuramyl-(pentapeptide) pyrophosphoryl-undecaprenol N-acetylglucosamine transferase [Chloroflexota bacterium]MDQ3408050.1 UDP-N-acetylglucosamine--N-acetylmuramyl-(pentapeptide) pyrophosphoryl-undecaprenol N-acetylglucosamine transferase [Chloroflexota bacterium]
MRILIAAGGTGGHIYPALAVLRCLSEQVDDLEVRWVGGHRGLEAGIVPAAGFRLDRLWLRSLRTVEPSVNTVADPVRLAASLPQALALLVRWRPQAVLATGGYVSIPVLTAAKAARVPSLVWAGDRIPGRSIQATARLASAMAVSFEGSCESLVEPCFLTGTPIRPLAGIDRVAARERLKLPAGGPLLLVFGGSQAVRRLNEAVAGALPDLLERTAVLHITGEPAYADAMRRREALPEVRRALYRPYPSLHGEMADALVAADLLVGRAGSSTLAEAAAVGLPLVVVPYPHAAAHQVANARQLVDAGAAIVIADEDFDAAALLEASRLLRDAGALERMSAASRAQARPAAARAVAELLLSLAERRPLPSRDQLTRLSREAA